MSEGQSLVHSLKYKDGDSTRRLIYSKLQEDLTNSIDKTAPKLHRGVHLCDSGCIARRGASDDVFPMEKNFVNVIISDHHIRVSSIKVGAGATAASLELKLEDTERAEHFPVLAGDLITLKATRWSLFHWGQRRFPTAYITVIINDIAYITNSSNLHFEHITQLDMVEAEKRGNKIGLKTIHSEEEKKTSFPPPHTRGGTTTTSIPGLGAFSGTRDEKTEELSLAVRQCIMGGQLPPSSPPLTASAVARTP